MSTATLSKPCRCKLCGGRMAAGEPFRWRRFTFSKPGRRLAKVERLKPVHAGDCPVDGRTAALLDAAAERHREELERERFVSWQEGRQFEGGKGGAK